MKEPPLPQSLTLEPIGVIRTPFADKRSAPRQPALARDVEGRIELSAGGSMEYAVADLDQWSHIWLIFWFHLNQGWHAKVAPPRSDTKRGVLSTRSPHRPNPLGLSVVALERVEGRVLHVRGVDMIDGTPLLDIKPYVPYSDVVDANSGWLEAPPDPGPRFVVSWTPRALEQLAWLQAAHAPELRGPVQELLSTGPSPHPYRRIKRDGARMRLAFQDFRLWFRVDGEQVLVEEIGSGYRKRVLEDPGAQATAATPLSTHRAFVQRFGR
ncbi:MAG: tRNA (N6-threonylcarbamoyladenosine(37)-N6)-methyltransferase TrmO [Myxococcales bacterium]|nr:tRNA (N6-threonylcarbamoyladenosine(37)-N6)-methyltransferase TrmO [Myxococcales bacterium]